MKHAFDRFVQYLQKNYFSYWIVLGIDTFIALVCTWVSFIGIHYITETSKEIISLFHILVISVISSVLGSFLFHTYRNTIRFSQLKELWRIAGSALIKAVCIAMAIWLFLPQTGLHNSQKIVFVLFDGMLTFIAMVGFRIQLILVYELLLNMLNKKNNTSQNRYNGHQLRNFNRKIRHIQTICPQCFDKKSACSVPDKI